MKRKMLMIPALLAVMVAMTGIAAANPARIDIDPSTDASVLYHPLDGSTMSYTTRFSDMQEGTRRIQITNTLLDSIRLHGDGVDITVAPGTTGTVTGWTPTGNPTQDITLDVTTDNAGRVTIKTCLDDGSTNCNSDTAIDFGGASNQINIPEFPTVALPIAAVIGLVFVFNSRKNKEEDERERV